MSPCSNWAWSLSRQPLSSLCRSNSNYKYRRRNKSGGDSASDLSSADEYFITRRQNILHSLEAEESKAKTPPGPLCPPCQCTLLGDSNSSSCSSTAPLLKSLDESFLPTTCTCKHINCLKCRNSALVRQTKISGQPNLDTISKQSESGCQHQGTVEQNFLNSEGAFHK